MGEFEGGDEAGLLVEATEAAGGVDDIIFFLEGFAGHSLIKLVKGLFDLVGVLIAVQSWLLRYCAILRTSRSYRFFVSGFLPQ